MKFNDHSFILLIITTLFSIITLPWSTHGAMQQQQQPDNQAAPPSPLKPTVTTTVTVTEKVGDDYVHMEIVLGTYTITTLTATPTSTKVVLETVTGMTKTRRPEIAGTVTVTPTINAVLTVVHQKIPTTVFVTQSVAVPQPPQQQ